MSDNGAVVPEFPERMLKKLPKGTKDLIEAMGTDEIKKKLIDCARSISEVERDMENDTVLGDLKEDLAAKIKPYREAIKASRIMMKYLVFILENRGAV